MVPRLAAVLVVLAVLAVATAAPGRWLAAQEATPAGDCPTTTEDQNRELVRRYIDANFNTDDPTIVDEVLAPDHDQPAVPGQQGPDEIEAAITAGFPAIPDLEADIVAVLADGDMASVLVSLHGTHEGELLGAEPTGNEVAWTGMATFRIECGLIVESWVVADNLGLYEQVGLDVVPADEAAATPAA